MYTFPLTIYNIISEVNVHAVKNIITVILYSTLPGLRLIYF